MPALGDNHMIMQPYPKAVADVADLVGHLDVGFGRGRVARRVAVNRGASRFGWIPLLSHENMSEHVSPGGLGGPGD